MSDIIKNDNEYKEWIYELKSRYRSSQIKAASSVNKEMLLFYWSLGRDIVSMDAENRYGKGFYDSLSLDLRNTIPNAKGFSNRNLRYMKAFYLLYFESDPNLPQVVADFGEKENLPQVVAKLNVTNIEREVFLIPWGHHRLIIDKCNGDRDRALFFVRKTLENNWSRAMLLNFLDTNLYERQGKAISNFDKTLPLLQGDLAQEMTKDPYNFDFLTITEGYHEKELKDALMDNIQRFLLELGTGFSFVGREYRLVVGETEQFIDLLFYNIKLHCYVVIEIKVTDFEPAFMGQLSTYVAAVDGILRSDGDNQTLGLLICKTKDNVLAQYAVNSVKPPIAISEYELADLIPEDYKSSLPTIEEIERELESSLSQENWK